MGLLLRPDAYCAETPTGMYLLTHAGESTITGGSVWRLFQRLAPFLDGRHTLARLTAGLTDDGRAAVEKLVAVLLDRGVVRDVSGDASGDVSPDRASGGRSSEAIRR